MKKKIKDLLKKLKTKYKGSKPYEIAFKVYYGLKRIYGNTYLTATLKILFPYIYKKNAGPVKSNKVIFIEVREGKLSGDFKQLYDMLKRDYKVNIHIHYLEDYKVGRIEYTKRCINLVKDMADAKYVFISDACRPTSSLPLRKETVLMQVWHACGAFKRFGLSTADQLFGEDRKQQTRFPFHGNYTYAAVSSDEVVWAYEDAFGLERGSGVVKGCGISRTDVFYDEEFVGSARSRIEEFFPESKGKKIILYAPTFRGRVATAAAPDQLDIKKLCQAFGDEYVLLTKHHPFVKELPEIPEECAAFARDCTGKLNIDDCLSAADICITDYSSIIYEYSLFERPMIFFAYDLDDYNDWRGFFYPYEEMTPGPICKTNEEIIDYIKGVSEGFDKTQVHDFKEKFMGACDGHATEKILKLVMGNNEERLRK